MFRKLIVVEIRAGRKRKKWQRRQQPKWQTTLVFYNRGRRKGGNTTGIKEANLGKISIILMQNAVSEKVKIKHRDLEELLEELHDTSRQIDYTLDQLRKGKTGFSEKKRQKLCKE